MKMIIEYISQGIAFASIAIIVYGTVLAIIQFIKSYINKSSFGIRQIRAGFGGYLLLGLELLIGADIIKTIVEPTYEELIILAGIIILRTILSVFLNKEIKDLESEQFTCSQTANRWLKMQLNQNRKCGIYGMGVIN